MIPHMSLLSLSKALLLSTTEKVRGKVRQVLTGALDPVQHRDPIPYDVAPKTAAEAINMTFGSVAEIRAETKERRKWAYLVVDVDSASEAARACTFYGRPDAPYRVGKTSTGRHMIAVWMEPGIPTTEPVFG
jgi:hypothetical protein